MRVNRWFTSLPTSEEIKLNITHFLLIARRYSSEMQAYSRFATCVAGTSFRGCLILAICRMLVQLMYLRRITYKL